MVKVLEYGRQVCLGVALAMMLASLVALPHNRVLADEGGPGGAHVNICESCHVIDPETDASKCKISGPSSCTADSNCRLDPTKCASCKCELGDACACK